MAGVTGAPCTEISDPNNLGSEVIPAWATQAWPAEECEWVLTVGAHGQAGTPFAQDSTSFTVPAGDTSYYCFYEAVPWGDKPVQALAVRARLESPTDQALVHHYVVSSITPLSQSIKGATPNGPGDIQQCDNPSGSTIGIYAPGAVNPLAYPSDVGMQMPSGLGAYIELQIHFNNPNHLPFQQSRAQYDICVTSKPRPQTAGVFWLGFQNAGPQTVTGTNYVNRLDNQSNGKAVGLCQAKTQGRILSIMPHMHQHGRHSLVEVVKKDGTVIPALDKPFDFQEQTAYFRDNFWIEQGDTIRSTCTWDQGPVYFGFSSADEMCFMYTLAYPLEVFKPNPLEVGVIDVGGALGCAGMPGP
jgi:hypothetical protein